jgi:hypothetical protein
MHRAASYHCPGAQQPLVNKTEAEVRVASRVLVSTLSACAFAVGLTWSRSSLPRIVEAPIDEPSIVVATVASVSAAPATNADPPRIGLEVEKVLLGSLRPGPYMAVWRPRWHGREWDPPRGWEAMAVPKPDIGARFILFGAYFSGCDCISAPDDGRVVYSEERLKWASEGLGQTKMWEAAAPTDTRADRKRHEVAFARWVASFADAPVERITREAAFIAVARMSPRHPTAAISFQAETVLKGQTRGYYPGGTEFLQLANVLSWEPHLWNTARRFVIFLRPLQPIVDPSKPPGDYLVDMRCGIMPATDDLVMEVRRLIERR